MRIRIRESDGPGLVRNDLQFRDLLSCAAPPMAHPRNDDCLSRHRREATMACDSNANHGWRVPRQPGAERFANQSEPPTRP